MAVSVPKRLFKRAVDRNLLKRRIREAYRILKPELYSDLTEKNSHIQMVIQYRSKEIAAFQAIEKSMLRAMKQIGEVLLKDSSE